jgi:hypothetical protein
LDPSLSGSSILSADDVNGTAEPVPNPTEFPSQDVDTSHESEGDTWGIRGLLSIMGGEDSDKSRLALGVDLTSLGLNMNQPEYLSPGAPS